MTPSEDFTILEYIQEFQCFATYRQLVQQLANVLTKNAAHTVFTLLRNKFKL